MFRAKNLPFFLHAKRGKFWYFLFFSSVTFFLKEKALPTQVLQPKVSVEFSNLILFDKYWKSWLHIFTHTIFVEKKKHTNGDLKCKFQNFYQFNFQTKRHPFGKLTGKASFLFSTSKLWWIANMSCVILKIPREARKNFGTFCHKNISDPITT